MNFSYSDEQEMLKESVARFVKHEYDFDVRREILQSAMGFSQDNWQKFAELGWLMVPFSEDDNGLGGSAVDLMIVMQEFGKAMVVEPFIHSVVLGGGLLAAAGNQSQKEDLLNALMEGQLQLSFACNEPHSRYHLNDIATIAAAQGDHYVINGQKAVVFNAAAADKLIVAVRTSGQQRDRNGISLILVDKNLQGVSLQAYQTVDGHSACEIYFKDVQVPAGNLLGEEGAALPIIERQVDRATLALCAEAIGAMEVALNKTVEYTKTRQQFGRPISSFQALQHRMADMFIECEQARSILIMCAMQFDSKDGDAPKAVSAAKSRIGKAAQLVGQEAVQLHGGIGVTDELDVGHLFKRLTTIQYLFGSTDFHTQRFIQQ